MIFVIFHYLDIDLPRNPNPTIHHFQSTKPLRRSTMKEKPLRRNTMKDKPLRRNTMKMKLSEVEHNS